MWYMRRIFENRALVTKPGCGWLPNDWLFGEGVKRGHALWRPRKLDLGGYGEPKGYPPLRQLVRDLLAEQEVVVPPTRCCLTQGSSQGLDLAARGW